LVPSIITADCPRGLKPNCLSRRGAGSMDYDDKAYHDYAALPRNQAKEHRARIESAYKNSESHDASRLSFANPEDTIMEGNNSSRASDNTKNPLSPKPKSSPRWRLTQEQPKSSPRRSVTPKSPTSSVRHTLTHEQPKPLARAITPSNMRRLSPTPPRNARNDENTLVSKTLLTTQRSHERFEICAPPLSRARSTDFWGVPLLPDLLRKRTTGTGLVETKPSTQRSAVAQDFVRVLHPESIGKTELKSCLKKGTDSRALASVPESIGRKTTGSFPNSPPVQIFKPPADMTDLQLLRDINSTHIHQCLSLKEQYVQLTMSGEVVICSTEPSMISTRAARSA
jgi:hypothetical protein